MGIAISNPTIAVDEITIKKVGETIQTKVILPYSVQAVINSPNETTYETTSASYQDLITLSTPKPDIANRKFLVEFEAFLALNSATALAEQDVLELYDASASAQLSVKSSRFRSNNAVGDTNENQKLLTGYYVLTMPVINTAKSLKLRYKSDGTRNLFCISAKLKISYLGDDPNP